MSRPTVTSKGGSWRSRNLTELAYTSRLRVLQRAYRDNMGFRAIRPVPQEGCRLLTRYGSESEWRPVPDGVGSYDDVWQLRHLVDDLGAIEAEGRVQANFYRREDEVVEASSFCEYTPAGDPLEWCRLDAGTYIARYPVTWTMYRAWLESTLKGWSLKDRRDSRMAGLPFALQDEHPVVRVTLHEARSWCAWVGRGVRLPTEAEWEWAVHGGDPDRKYPWGSEAPLRRDRLGTWDGYRDQGYPCEAPSTYERGASPVGAVGLAGNVWEMVEK